VDLDARACRDSPLGSDAGERHSAWEHRGFQPELFGYPRELAGAAFTGFFPSFPCPNSSVSPPNFELLTLRQTKKAPEIPIVLVDEAYWRSVINLDALLQAGMITPRDLARFGFADDAETAWASLVEQGLPQVSTPPDAKPKDI
jgi:hypothetical protein